MTLAQARELTAGVGIFAFLCWLWLVLMTFVQLAFGFGAARLTDARSLTPSRGRKPLGGFRPNRGPRRARLGAGPEIGPRKSRDLPDSRPEFSRRARARKSRSLAL
jgi:hypothetical protein